MKICKHHWVKSGPPYQDKGIWYQAYLCYKCEAVKRKRLYRP